MPKKSQELSPLAVSRLKEPGLHFVGGVAGLALQILPTGGKSWILRATIGRKRRDMGLGGYPDVPLADAKEAARSARDKIRKGIDPIEEGQAARTLLKMAQANAVPFEAAATSFIETHSPSWKNAKHAQQWTNSLAKYAYPIVGKTLVRDITVQNVLSVLEPIWRTKTETATRVRGRIEKILDWSTTKGYRDGLNPARWKGHLDNLLPQPGKIAKEEHHPALPVEDAGAFMLALRRQQGTGARALEFSIMAASRSGEVRGATWGEISLDKAEWIIPASRMKMSVEHKVPLPAAAVALLKALPSAHGAADDQGKPASDALVFPAPRGGMLSDATLNAVITRMNEQHDKPRWIDKKLNREAVQHGFRSTFRDWVEERTNFPHAAAEMALAHAIGNAVVAAYRRGDLFAKRRLMMTAWAEFLEHEETPANVIPLNRKTG